MEKYTDLKELLLVFLKVYFDRCVNDDEKEEIVLNDFLANNSLDLSQTQQLDIPRVINWVACKREIPLNRRVLARLVFKNIETTIIAGYSENNGWMSKGEKFSQNQITHWAELPEPPCL